MRRDPFAEYEDVSPINPTTPEMASRHLISAGNSERLYLYLPARGNKATICNGLKPDFMDDWLLPQQFNVVGEDKLDGKRVILLEAVPPFETSGHLELAVDLETKLTCQLRLIDNDAHGKPVETLNMHIDYDQTPPAGIFEWQPPAKTRPW